jgi:lysine 6-dehydrogenase
MRIVVLGGAGAMGQVIVRDLAMSSPVSEIVIADISMERAQQLMRRVPTGKARFIHTDIRSESSMDECLAGADVVINSAPYQFNLEVMEACLRGGCHYLDLGGLFHMTRKQLELHERFKSGNILAILGMGAAPGITNVMAAHAADGLDSVEEITITVGGVEFSKPNHPFLPPYSLDTILDEYALEPMVFEDGRFKPKAPMSAESITEMPWPVGKIRTFLTLHSEVATLPLTYKSKGIKRCTYRLGLPDSFHERAKFLVQLGFAAKDEVKVGDVLVSPRQMLARMVALHPEPDSDPNDCEVIRVDVRGQSDDKPAFVRMESVVYSHHEWHVSCGALDTGVPPSIVAQMIALGQIEQRGVLPPEQCVPALLFFDELQKRQIPMRKTTQEELSVVHQQEAPLEMGDFV